MEEEEFQKKVLNEFGEIAIRLINIEEKLNNIESDVNFMRKNSYKYLR